MAKKKTSNTGALLKLLASFMGFATLAVLLLPLVSVEKLETTYTGLQIAFGYSEKTLFGMAEVFKFSFMNCLPYALAIIGVTLAIFSGLKGSKFFALIAGLIFIAEGVLFLFSIDFVVPVVENETLINLFKDTLNLAYGAIIGAVVAFVAGLFAVVSSFVK